jgi:hypothetical protein
LGELAVPYAEQSKAEPLQFGIPSCVMGVVGVLAAIELDNEAGIEAEEVRNVLADRDLSAEFVAGKPAVPQ